MWNYWDGAYGQIGHGTHHHETSWSTHGYGSNQSFDWDKAGDDHYKHWYSSQSWSWCDNSGQYFNWDEPNAFSWNTWDPDASSKRRRRESSERKLNSIAAARGMSVEELMISCRETGKKSIKYDKGHPPSQDCKRTLNLNSDTLPFVKRGVSFKDAYSASKIFLKPLTEFATWKIRMRTQDSLANVARVTVITHEDTQNRQGVEDILALFFHNLVKLGPDFECLFEEEAVAKGILAALKDYVDGELYCPLTVTTEANPVEEDSHDHHGQSDDDDFKPDWGADEDAADSSFRTFVVPMDWVETCKEPVFKPVPSPKVFNESEFENFHATTTKKIRMSQTWTEISLPCEAPAGKLFLTGYRPTIRAQMQAAAAKIQRHSVKLVLNCQAGPEMLKEQEYFSSSSHVKILPWNPNFHKVEDEFVLSTAVDMILRGYNIMLHCNCGQYRSAIQACKLIMIFYGCGWYTAATMLLEQRPFICVEVDRENSNNGLLKLQRQLYHEDGNFDMERRTNFFRHIFAETVAGGPQERNS